MPIRTIPFGRIFLFISLSALDLCLTWQLIGNGDGLVYEGNPIANWWLTHCGWLGLTRTAGLVLSFACAALGVVVLYSSSLAGYVAMGPDRPATAQTRYAEERSALLDREMGNTQEYLRLMKALSEALADQRCTLSEAVAQLACTEQSRNPRWLDILRLYYPERTDEECLAASIVEFTAGKLKQNPAAAERIARRLEADFCATYGTPLPRACGSALDGPRRE